MALIYSRTVAEASFRNAEKRKSVMSFSSTGSTCCMEPGSDAMQSDINSGYDATHKALLCLSLHWRLFMCSR